jgi:hypothetical protein
VSTTAAGPRTALARAGRPSARLAAACTLAGSSVESCGMRSIVND